MLFFFFLKELEMPYFKKMLGYMEPETNHVTMSYIMFSY